METNLKLYFSDLIKQMKFLNTCKLPHAMHCTMCPTTLSCSLSGWLALSIYSVTAILLMEKNLHLTKKGEHELSAGTFYVVRELSAVIFYGREFDTKVRLFLFDLEEKAKMLMPCEESFNYDDQKQEKIGFQTWRLMWNAMRGSIIDFGG